MAKKLFIILVALFVILGCSPKKEKEAETKTDEVEFYHAPLPNFAEMFTHLDYLNTVDFDQAVPEKFESKHNDVFKAAFYVGALTADAVLATKSRNKTKLTAIAKQMIDYSKFIGISQDILKMADDLNVLITGDKWDELEDVLENYKTQVEVSLHTSGEYDIFTLLQFGGWNEGLNRVTYLLKENYNKDKSSFISQKGILNQLIVNFDQIRNESIREERYYKESSSYLHAIKEIIYQSEEKTYTLEQINQIFELTEKIKAEF